MSQENKNLLSKSINEYLSVTPVSPEAEKALHEILTIYNSIDNYYISDDKTFSPYNELNYYNVKPDYVTSDYTVNNSANPHLVSRGNSKKSKENKKIIDGDLSKQRFRENKTRSRENLALNKLVKKYDELKEACKKNEEAIENIEQNLIKFFSEQKSITITNYINSTINRNRYDLSIDKIISDAYNENSKNDNSNKTEIENKITELKSIAHDKSKKDKVKKIIGEIISKSFDVGVALLPLFML